MKEKHMIKIKGIYYSIDHHITTIDEEVKAYQKTTILTGVNDDNQIVFELASQKRFFNRADNQEVFSVINYLNKDDNQVLSCLFDKVNPHKDVYDEKQKIMAIWLGFVQDRLELEQQPYHSQIS